MYSQTQIITPAIAAAYLALNTKNRPLRTGVVRALARAMERGEWVLSPQGIALSSEGWLVDGQHRLSAVVLSNQTVPMTVFSNVPPDVFAVYDRGISRTLADATRLPRRHVEVLTFFHKETAGQAEKPTSAQILALDAVFGPDIAELTEYAPRASKVFASAGGRAAVALLSKEGQRNRAFDLYRRLSLNDFAGLPPIVSALVKNALSDNVTRRGGSSAQVEVFCKMLAALDEKNAGRVLAPRFTDVLRDSCAARVREWVK